MWLGASGFLENVAIDMLCFLEQFQLFSAGISETEGADIYLFVARSRDGCTSCTIPGDRGVPTTIDTTSREARSACLLVCVSEGVSHLQTGTQEAEANNSKAHARNVDWAETVR